MGSFGPVLWVTLVAWCGAAALYALAGGRRPVLLAAHALTGLGLLVLGGFLGHLWWQLGRPPMRSLGETRLWYSLFLPVVGAACYLRWGYRWLLAWSLLVAAVFLGLNLARPENFDRALMPALQSPWFIPHVILFIFSYSVLGAAALVAARGLWGRPGPLADARGSEGPDGTGGSAEIRGAALADQLVRLGFSLFTIAMLFGALWAKEAWGHYWTWDPKETWAFLAWVVYLVYLHLRHVRPRDLRTANLTLVLAFLVLLVCWFGVNYLPGAASSVHVYS
jgi:ABC-type transport system involved in cytochrome c biogenesis permease subunit